MSIADDLHQYVHRLLPAIGLPQVGKSPVFEAALEGTGLVRVVVETGCDEARRNIETRTRPLVTLFVDLCPVDVGLRRLDLFCADEGWQAHPGEVCNDLVGHGVEEPDIVRMLRGARTVVLVESGGPIALPVVLDERPDRAGRLLPASALLRHSVQNPLQRTAKT